MLASAADFFGKAAAAFAPPGQPNLQARRAGGLAGLANLWSIVWLGLAIGEMQSYMTGCQDCVRGRPC
jgi:hypothetical protein